MSAKNSILLYLEAIGPNAQFNGIDIVKVAYGHTLSAMRTLRRLREEGLINYKCIDMRKSMYKLISVRRYIIK